MLRNMPIPLVTVGTPGGNRYYSVPADNNCSRTVPAKMALPLLWSMRAQGHRDRMLVMGTDATIQQRRASGIVLLQLPKGGGTDRSVSWMILEASV